MMYTVFWESNSMLYVRLSSDKIHVYPMIHIFRIETEDVSMRQLPVVKEV